MMQTPELFTGAASFAAIFGALLGLLKSARGRKVLLVALDLDTGLDEKISTAINTSVAALQAALDVRGEDMVKMEAELSALQAEVKDLITADAKKTARITELEEEISTLREENNVLREELSRRRGGRPRKETTDL